MSLIATIILPALFPPFCLLVKHTCGKFFSFFVGLIGQSSSAMIKITIRKDTVLYKKIWHKILFVCLFLARNIDGQEQNSPTALMIFFTSICTDEPMIKCAIMKVRIKFPLGGDVAQLVEHRTGTPPTQVRFPCGKGFFSQRQRSVQTLLR